MWPHPFNLNEFESTVPRVTHIKVTIFLRNGPLYILM